MRCPACGKEIGFLLQDISGVITLSVSFTRDGSIESEPYDYEPADAQDLMTTPLRCPECGAEFDIEEARRIFSEKKKKDSWDGYCDACGVNRLPEGPPYHIIIQRLDRIYADLLVCEECFRKAMKTLRQKIL